MDEQNQLKLQELAPEREHEVIKSIDKDKDKDKHTQLLNLSMPESKAKTGGLVGEPVSNVLSLPSNNWMKIAHLNIHSYLAKWKDIVIDQAMRQTNIMCFTETC